VQAQVTSRISPYTISIYPALTTTTTEFTITLLPNRPPMTVTLSLWACFADFQQAIERHRLLRLTYLHGLPGSICHLIEQCAACDDWVVSSEQELDI